MSGTNGNTPYTHVDKKAGDVIRSEDWNAAMNEVMRLDQAKVNREGVDLIKGPLTIEDALNANNANLDGTLQAESILLREELSVPTITATDVTFSGTLQGTDITLSESLTAAELIVSQATVNGPLTAESLTVASNLSTDRLTIGDAATPTGQTKLSVDGAIQAAQLNARGLMVTANGNNGPSTNVTHEGLFFLSDQSTGEASVREARNAITKARTTLANAQGATVKTQQTLDQTGISLRLAERNQQGSEQKADKLRSQIKSLTQAANQQKIQADQLLAQAKAFENHPFLKAQSAVFKQQALVLQSQERALRQNVAKLSEELKGVERQFNQHRADVQKLRSQRSQLQQRLANQQQAEKRAEQSLDQALNDPRLKSLAYGLDTRQADSLVYNTYKHHRWNTRGEETMTLNESGLLSVQGISSPDLRSIIVKPKKWGHSNTGTTWQSILTHTLTPQTTTHATLIASCHAIVNAAGSACDVSIFVNNKTISELGHPSDANFHYGMGVTHSTAWVPMQILAGLDLTATKKYVIELKIRTRKQATESKANVNGPLMIILLTGSSA